MPPSNFSHTSPKAIYPFIHPLGLPPTFVAGDEPHGVTFRFFDCHEQGGRAGHHYGHMSGSARELCVEQLKAINSVQNEHQLILRVDRLQLLQPLTIVQHMNSVLFENQESLLLFAY